MKENVDQQMQYMLEDKNEETNQHIHEKEHMRECNRYEKHDNMNMEHNRFELNVPYPEIKNIDKNPQYAKLLQDDYAGVVSELTAITQYSYHHFITEDQYKEVSDTFAGVAIVEMRHLELLGEAIIQLGGDPIFAGTFSNAGQFWNGSYVKYSKGIRQILFDAIRSEQEAIAQYKKHISMISDINIRQLLERIILDEQFHITIFNNLLKKVTG